DKKGPWQSGPQQYKRRAAPETIILEPGKSRELSSTMKPPYTWLGNRGEREAGPEGLPPGKYQATAYIEFRAFNDLHPVPHWAGVIPSNPVEFEIAAKPAGAKTSETVVQDGLAVTLTLPKSMFAPDEKPTF